MTLHISEYSWQDLRRHGEEVYPREACGVLVGSNADGERTVTRSVRCTNVRAAAACDRYAIDPRDLLRVEREARARGEAIVGFYHSHPDHPPRPSPTDLAEAYWTGCSYVITRVARGRADATCSFVLRGDDDARRFDEEELRVDATGSAAPGREEPA